MCFNSKKIVRLGINKRNIFGANRVKFRRKIACAEFRRIGVSKESSVVYGFFPVWLVVKAWIQDAPALYI